MHDVGLAAAILKTTRSHHKNFSRRQPLDLAWLVGLGESNQLVIREWIRQTETRGQGYVLKSHLHCFVLLSDLNSDVARHI